MSSNACIQRRLFVSLENSSRNRIELVNPYTNFTKEQLDMRRKAEILKYKKNAKIVTRQERFRLLAHNIGKRNRSCLNDPVQSRPTTSSDVPGPIILLNNSTVAPLYNYTSLSLEQTNLVPPPNNKNKPFDAIPIPRVGIRNIFNPVANLAILSPNFRNYSFTATIPLFLTITGNKTLLNQNNGTIIQSIIASTSNVQFQVTYNNQRITTTPNVNNLLSNTDILLNLPGDTFSARKYIGNIRFSSFRLKTCGEYVYTFQLSSSISYNAYDSQGNVIARFVPTGLGYTLTANISQQDSSYFSVSNCTMVNPPTLPIVPFAVTAVPFGSAELS
jgi:hypothetical protein